MSSVHDTITEACEHCGHGWSYHVPRCTTCGCMWSPSKPPEPPPQPPTERDLLIARIRAAIYQELDRQHENDEIDAAGYWDSEWGRLDGEPNWDGVSAAVLDALSAAGFVVRKQVEPALVTTQEELDALPFLSIIREKFRPSPSGANYGGVYERRTSGWQCIAGVYKDGPGNGSPKLPCRVLYDPEQVEP